MTQTLIFDLPNVLIAGLNGLEAPLAARLDVPADTVLPAFWGFPQDLLYCGLISEDQYLRLVCERRGWSLPLPELKQFIRQALAQPRAGMPAVVRALAERYRLVLYSDQAIEWVEAIHAAHPWLAVFAEQIFSYELRLTKRDPRAFRQVARRVCLPTYACLVVDHSQANLRTAAAAGLRGLFFVGAEQLAQDLAMLGVA
jgi:FMN phosphatase YigB (HAD superfamily)